MLLHIILPEQEISPLYISRIIETADGDHLVGLLMAETPTSVTLRRPLGQEDTILRKDIVSMYDDSLSLMPQELADLIAYLGGSSTPTHPTTAAGK